MYRDEFLSYRARGACESISVECKFMFTSTCVGSFSVVADLLAVVGCCTCTLIYIYKMNCNCNCMIHCIVIRTVMFAFYGAETKLNGNFHCTFTCVAVFFQLISRATFTRVGSLIVVTQLLTVVSNITRTFINIYR